MIILPIKKKWFDMIKSGEKKHEYREIKPYYNSRFKDKLFEEIVFRNGYRKDSPKVKCMCIIRKGQGYEQWGAEKRKRVLHIRDIKCRGGIEMEEIKVGEYIRNKQGLLLKILNLDEALDMYMVTDNEYKAFISRDDIVKHSKNIIDLLDLEDYANGDKIITINYINNYIMTLCINEVGEKAVKVLRDFEIESIVTKEQFADIEYKVEK